MDATELQHPINCIVIYTFNPLYVVQSMKLKVLGNIGNAEDILFRDYWNLERVSCTR